MPALRTQMGEDVFEERLKHIPLAEKRDKWELAAKGGFTDRSTPLFDLGNAKPAFGQPVVGPSDVVFFFDSQLNRVYRLQGLGSPPTPAACRSSPEDPLAK